MILAWVLGLAVLGIVALALWLYAPDKSRAELEAIYPGDYRTIDGVRLRLRDTGPRDAPAVILLHGFAWTLGSPGRRRYRRATGSYASTCRDSA